MLPLLSPAETRKWEEISAERQGITSFDLMRRAGKAFAKEVIQQFPHKKITIVCGTGNNGGDGLCIAKNLLEAGKKVSVWVIDSEKKSENFLKAWRKFEHPKKIKTVKTVSSKMLETELLIDAIFGYGLSRPLAGVYAESAAAMNEAKAVRLAVDIPSGLFADKPSEGIIFRAHFTYTFELPKLAMLLPENYPYAGEWKTLKINLESAENAATSHYWIEKSDVKKILRTRTKFDHKGMFGHAYIIAGSKGKMGAAVLSARAALASGAGLLTVHIPASGATVIHASLPEAMVSADVHPDYFTKHIAQNFSACGVGPGLGMNEATVQALKLLLKEKKPCVIDADALNILAENPSMQKLISPGSILTPHLKEFERLVGASSNPYERLEKLSTLANKLMSVVILKGACTAIASPEGKIFFNPTGNPGMATAGAGDVLTGVLTSFLAQGYSALNTAILGVYFHGLAGDLAILNKGTIISSDIISCLPKALGGEFCLEKSQKLPPNKKRIKKIGTVFGYK